MILSLPAGLGARASSWSERPVSNLACALPIPTPTPSTLHDTIWPMTTTATACWWAAARLPGRCQQRGACTPALACHRPLRLSAPGPQHCRTRRTAEGRPDGSGQMHHPAQRARERERRPDRFVHVPSRPLHFLFQHSGQEMGASRSRRPVNFSLVSSARPLAQLLRQAHAPSAQLPHNALLASESLSTAGFRRCVWPNLTPTRPIHQCR